MYKVGDLIYYGDTGICKVTDITQPKLPSIKKNRLYYVLETLYDDCVIYTPIDNENVFMRPIISASQAKDLIDAIPTVEADIFHSRVLNQLKNHYEKIISSHKCEDLIEMTVSINAKKKLAEQNNQKFGAVDEKFKKRAEDLLFGELAAALDIPKDTVYDYIADRVGVEKIQSCM